VYRRTWDASLAPNEQCCDFHYCGTAGSTSFPSCDAFILSVPVDADAGK